MELGDGEWCLREALDEVGGGVVVRCLREALAVVGGGEEDRSRAGRVR